MFSASPKKVAIHPPSPQKEDNTFSTFNPMRVRIEQLLGFNLSVLSLSVSSLSQKSIFQL